MTMAVPPNGPARPNPQFAFAFAQFVIYCPSAYDQVQSSVDGVAADRNLWSRRSLINFCLVPLILEKRPARTRDLAYLGD